MKTILIFLLLLLPLMANAQAPRAMAFTTNTATVVSNIVRNIVTNSPIRYDNIGSVPTPSILGRTTAGAGVIETITAGTGLTLSSGVLSANVSNVIHLAAGSDIDVVTNSPTLRTMSVSDNIPRLNAFNVFGNNNEFQSSAQFDSSVVVVGDGYFSNRVNIGSTASVSVTNQVEIHTRGGMINVGTNGVLYGNGSGLTGVIGSGGGNLNIFQFEGSPDEAIQLGTNSAWFETWIAGARRSYMTDGTLFLPWSSIKLGIEPLIYTNLVGGGDFQWSYFDYAGQLKATTNSGFASLAGAAFTGDVTSYRQYDTNNVRHPLWGAKGDGSTDDGPAFTNALAHITNLYVPDGVYLTSLPLFMPQDAGGRSIRGQSYNDTIIVATAAMPSVLTIGSTNGQSTRFELSNFRIDAANLATNGIYSARVDTSLFKRMFVQGAKATGYGINVGYGWNNDFLELESCFNAGGGLRLSRDFNGEFANNACNLTGVKVFNNGGIGMLLEGPKAPNIQGCTIENNAVAGIFFKGGEAATMSSCHFENNAATGFTFTNPAVTVRSDIIFSGEISDAPIMTFDNSTRSPQVLGNWATGSTNFITAIGVNNLTVNGNVGRNYTTLVQVVGNTAYGFAPGILPIANSGFTNLITPIYTTTTADMNTLIDMNNGRIAIGKVAQSAQFELATNGLALVVNTNALVVLRTNVGVGTATPQNLLTLQKVDVLGSTPGIDFFGTRATVDLTPFNVGRIYGVFDGDTFQSGRFTIASATGGGTFGDVLTVKYGNVGIGTTTPSEKLDVVGVVKAGGTNSAVPAFKAAGTNLLIAPCPDGGSWILRIGNDGSISTTTNTAGL